MHFPLQREELYPGETGKKSRNWGVTANKLNFEMSAQIYKGIPIRKLSLKDFEKSAPLCAIEVTME